VVQSAGNSRSQLSDWKSHQTCLGLRCYYFDGPSVRLSKWQIADQQMAARPDIDKQLVLVFGVSDAGLFPLDVD
jgi:hypothetical protein